MKITYKKKIIILCVTLIAGALFIYVDNSFKFSSAIENSTNIVVIKREYDEKGDMKFESKYLSFTDKNELHTKLENQYLFFLYRTDGYYGLPYLPITEYEIYFDNRKESVNTIKILENGFISNGYTIYYSTDRLKLFKQLDDFYNNLK